MVPPHPEKSQTRHHTLSPADEDNTGKFIYTDVIKYESLGKDGTTVEEKEEAAGVYHFVQGWKMQGHPNVSHPRSHLTFSYL